MPFELGHKKSPGRKKGSKNKDKQSVADKAKELGVDVTAVLIHIVNNNWKALGYDKPTKTEWVGADAVPVEVERIQLEHRMSAGKDLMKFMHPQLKAIEHTGADGKDLNAPVIVYAAEWGGTAEPTDGNANASEEDT